MSHFSLPEVTYQENRNDQIMLAEVYGDQPHIEP